MVVCLLLIGHIVGLSPTFAFWWKVGMKPISDLCPSDCAVGC